MSDFVDDQSTVVEIAADLRALRFAGHHTRVITVHFLQVVAPRLQAFIGFRGVGADEAARGSVVHIERFVPDQVLQEHKRFEGSSMNRIGPWLAQPPLQIGRDLQSAAQHPMVA